MILSDREVRAAIRGGVIGVTPCPPDSDKRWASTTLDLTLADEIRPWLPQGGAGADVIIDPSTQTNSFLREHNPSHATGKVTSSSRKLLFLAGRQRRLSFQTSQRLEQGLKARVVWRESASAYTSRRPRFTPVSARKTVTLTLPDRRFDLRSGTLAP